MSTITLPKSRAPSCWSAGQKPCNGSRCVVSHRGGCCYFTGAATDKQLHSCLVATNRHLSTILLASPQEEAACREQPWGGLFILCSRCLLQSELLLSRCWGLRLMERSCWMACCRLQSCSARAAHAVLCPASCRLGSQPCWRCLSTPADT